MPLDLRLSFALAFALAAGPYPAFAQGVVQPLPGTSDADRLAEQMRALATNPQDVNALVTAGELSVRLDDLTAAASLFARAEKVDPRNARLKAGEASVLVRSERPGEALRYYAQAQALGLDPARFAGDRGLAYDLIGEQERAQRDYRTALRQGADEEVTRRYALSLGISGKRDLALEQLDPLLRETDRGAWRARAFILAMAGDVAGAERIATTMMPPGMATGLQPFFQRLPTLPAVDRAFAVHFGEVRPSGDRIADARLVPPLPALGPDPYAPVETARTATSVQVAAVDDRRRKKDRKAKPGRVELAQAVQPRAAAALPPPPAYTGQPVAVYEPAPRPSAAAAQPNATARANAAQLASLRSDVAAVPVPVQPQRRGRPVSVPVRTAPAVALAEAVPTQAPVPTPRPASQPTQLAYAAPVRAPVAVPVTPPVQFVAAPPAPLPEPVAVPTPVPLTTPSPVTAPTAQAADEPTLTAASARVFATSEPAATVPAPAPQSEPVPVALASRGEADAILARIIAGLSIPAAELDVAPPAPRAVRAAPTTTPAATVVAGARAKEARDAAAAKIVADKLAADQAAADKAAADKVAADKADRRKAALDRKALAAKKAADAKRLADAKAAADEKKAARANPARIWVQVAGGANEGDLSKAYAATKAKAPTAFAGRSAWSTPLRATNRVLTGPFKTDADARAFVNQLAKAGVSAFTFTSDAGQPVTRLPAK